MNSELVGGFNPVENWIISPSRMKIKNSSNHHPENHPLNFISLNFKPIFADVQTVVTTCNDREKPEPQCTSEQKVNVELPHRNWLIYARELFSMCCFYRSCQSNWDGYSNIFFPKRDDG